MDSRCLAANVGHEVQGVVSMLRRVVLVSAVLAFSAVGVQADTPKPVYGAWGVDFATQDKAVKPGDDFFRYVLGKWLDSAKIPPDRTFTGVDLTIDETYLRPRVRAIVEDPAAAKAPEGSSARRVADFYASFMDTKTIAARGIAPIKADLDAVDGITTRSQLSDALARNFRQGVGSPLGGYVDIDSKHPDQYLMRFWQDGLSFGERNYYLDDKAEFKELRAKFVTHVAKMLTLAGYKDGAAQADLVLKLETEIAKTHWTVEAARQEDKTYNIWRKADFATKAPGIAWEQAFQILDLSGQSEFIVSMPDMTTKLAKLVETAPMDQWKAYLRYQTLSAAASSLPPAFDDENFAFYGVVIRGQKVQQDRWKRGMTLMNSVLGEDVGRVYVERHFPLALKNQTLAMVDVFRTALGGRIQNAKWMSASTKAEALAKLKAFGAKIGFPDKWKDYSTMTVKRDDLIANMRSAQEWSYKFNLNKLGKPIDRAEWLMNPQENNAYYWPQMNEIVFPAGILQPPYFDPAADAAVNYGSIGATIGHEMGHGFDDQGRKSDAKGMLRDWWTKEDAERYMAEAKKLVEQYNKYSPVKGINLNGGQTLGENIADLAGLIVAYDAYHLSLGGKPAPLIGGLTGDQRFFLAYAQSWKTKYRDERLRDLAISDVHSPAEYRVNGVVRNMDEWYAAFDVKPSDKLYLKPEDRARPW